MAIFVTDLEKNSKDLLDANRNELEKAFPELSDTNFDLSLKDALERRNVYGATSPKRVFQQAEIIKTKVENFFFGEKRTGK